MELSTKLAVGGMRALLHFILFSSLTAAVAPTSSFQCIDYLIVRPSFLFFRLVSSRKFSSGIQLRRAQNAIQAFFISSEQGTLVSHSTHTASSSSRLLVSQGKNKLFCVCASTYY